MSRIVREIVHFCPYASIIRREKGDIYIQKHLFRQELSYLIIKALQNINFLFTRS